MNGKIKAINWNWVIAQLIVHGYMVLAAKISFVDIMTLAERYGVPSSSSWTAPLLIDGLFWLGKMGRSDRWEDQTRLGGLVLMIVGGAGSFAANVYVGETVGMRVYGGIVVGGYVIVEWYAARLSPRPRVKTTAPAKPNWVVTEAEKAARKRAGYAKKSAAEKAAWTTEYRARLRKNAPTSPGVGPVSTYTGATA